MFRAADDHHPPPLGVRYDQAAHFAFRRDFWPESSDLGLDAVGAGAGTRVDTELHHHVALADEVLSKVGNRLALLPRADREVEEYKHPCHAIPAGYRVAAWATAGFAGGDPIIGRESFEMEVLGWVAGLFGRCMAMLGVWDFCFEEERCLLPSAR